MVYVVNKKGKPLMPTTRYGKVKRLLKSGKAVVINNNPFTIRLKYDTTEITQPLTLGIDTGRENIGLGVSNEKGECLYLANVITNNKNVTQNMQERREHRNSRRRHKRIRKQRKAIKNNTTIQKGNDDILRSKKNCKSIKISYAGMNESITHKAIKGKEAKFNNRKRPEGWITPSARNLIQIHINVVKMVQQILPITNIVVERVCFDFQKLENQNIANWQYSKGPLYGFKDYKDFINQQQKGKCLLCDNGIKHYHHINYRKDQGSDNPKNIAGLCDDCHELVHNNKEYEDILLSKKQGLRKQYSISLLNSCMDIIIDELNQILQTTVTTGFETYQKREELNLPKDHSIDGYVISLKELPKDLELPKTYTIRHFKKKSNNNINKLNRREYYYNNKLVAIGRHKAFNQKEDSLEEYLNLYKITHTQKETDRHFHELVIKPAKRTYTYHKQGIMPKFKCGDKVLYVKYNKIKGNTKRKVFIVEGLDINKERIIYNKTKNSKIKYCKILESKSLQYI